MTDEKDTQEQPMMAEAIPIGRDDRIPVAGIQLAFDPPAMVTPARFTEIIDAAINKLARSTGPRFQFKNVDVSPFSELPQPEPEPEKPLVITPDKKIVLTDVE